MKQLRNRVTRAAGFMLGLTGLAMWMMSMPGGTGHSRDGRPGARLGINAVTASALPTITVTNTNDSGPGSLRQAIADAAPGDTINFSVTGTITLTSGQLDINKNLTILGPGAASMTISGNNASRVVEIGVGVTVTISDLTISNGKTSSSDIGGGILNAGALTISNSTLSNNSASFNGGGIFTLGSGTLTISNSTLSNNSAAFSGGGIVNGGVLTISNSTLSGNSAGGFFGGGIFNGDNATLTITNSTLSNNSAAFDGGGILSVGALMISNSTLSNNSVQDFGGGISNGGALTISNSTLSNNSAGFGSGIFNGDRATATIVNSTLSNNSASGGGGGIYTFGSGTLIISNSTLSGNSARGSGGSFGGGGILNGNGTTLTISNSTLSNNSASGVGGSIFNFGVVSVKNSIVGNSPSGGDCGGGGILNALGLNFSTDGSCPGFTQVTAAQLNLGPLVVNEPGTTATHALLPGSVAIDAVTDCTDAFGIPVITDQRGVARPMDGDNNGTALCDVGAYEAAACTSDSIPPQITCPANVTAAVGNQFCPPLNGGVVTFPAPMATDNCPGVQTMCNPPSGSTFPVGTTAVTCTATDAAGNTASCTFSVTVFNGCLQDDSNPNIVVLFNATTGQYRFCCNGTVFTGTGTVILHGCTFTLQHYGPDRRLLVKADYAVKKGTASLQLPPGTTRCTITDRDMTNNTCLCP